MRLTLKQYKSTGVLVNKYAPLHNLLAGTGDDKKIVDFTTTKLSLYPQQKEDITCQPSYDGTVNLIMNDDTTVPKIINSKFTKLEGNQFKVITRNQKNQTNIYDEENLENDTSLFLTSFIFPKFHLNNVTYAGQLMGGNYTFYLKYCDDDYNETDVMAESGQVAIFKGIITNPKTISGCVLNERTDKSIILQLTNLDTAYKKFNLYYSRSFSDTNGIIMTEVAKIAKPFSFTDSEVKVTITGFEEVIKLTDDDLNMPYSIITAAKTQAQVQNMLFFGNVEKVKPNDKDLSTISYYIKFIKVFSNLSYRNISIF